MNRLTFFCLALVLFFGTSALAQSTFVRHYGTSGVEGGKCLIKDPKGNLIIGGYKGDSSLILRVNPGGEVVSQFTFRGLPGGPVENIVHMFVDRDFNLVGVGQARANFATFLFKFDLNANSMLWLRGTPLVADLGYIAEFPGKDDYFVVGDNKNNTSPGLAIDGHLMRVDRNTGAMTTLNRNYDLGSAETFSYVVNINDTLYLSGRYNKDGGGTAGMRHALTAMDTLGNIHYSRMYFVPTGTAARMYHGSVAVDGDSLVLGCTGNPSGTATNFSLHLTKVSHAGLNSWAKEYVVQGYNSVTLRHVENLPNGYLAAGYTNTAAQDLFLFEVDKTGNVIWAKRYGGTGSETMGPANALLIEDNHIYFTGMSEVPGHSEEVLLVKVNLDGEFDEDCSFGFDQVVTASPYNSLYSGLESLTDYVRPHTLLPPSTLSSPTFLSNDTICWSSLVAVESPGESDFSLRVVSGATSGRLIGFYASSSGGWANLRVVSSLGVNLFERKLWLQPGSGRFELEFPAAAGVYFAKLKEESTGGTVVKRFVLW